MDGWGIGLAIAASIALMIFSTLNLALRMPSRVRLEEQFEAKQRGGDIERFVAIRPQYMLATAVLRAVLTLTLLFIALDYVGASGSAPSTVETVVACALALLLVLIFGVAIPNAWAKYTGEWLIVRTLPLLSAVRFVCYPIIVVLQVFDPFVRRLAGVPVRDAQSYADELEQEILNVVSEGERHGAVDEEEKEMIESVIELSDKRAEEIMTPRTDVVAVPKEAAREDVLETIRTKGHSRIPVYDETIDTVLGALYAKDLLRQADDTPFDLTSIMREVYFIPESKLVRDLLREFQARKLHLAIVLDEYGGTAGLVTIEDILEELVGEIVDEYEPAAPAELVRIDEHTVEVDARMRIDDLNDELNLELPEDEDYETIGGFVFSAMGRIPRVGERCDHESVGIQVIAAEPRRILRLRLNITSTADKNRVQADPRP
ncbi:MAG: hemolysin family protein [Planctomycetota bacterium]